MKLQQQIGEKIKDIRTKQRLTQQTLAEKSNLDVSYISRIEAGEKNITIETLENISLALNIKSSELFISATEQIETSKKELVKLIENSLPNLDTSSLKLIYELISKIRGTK